MGSLINLVGSRQKASHSQCPEGRNSRMCWEGGAVAWKWRGGADFPGNEQCSWKCWPGQPAFSQPASGGSSRHQSHPTQMHAFGRLQRGPRELSLTPLPLTTSFDCLTDHRTGMGFVLPILAPQGNTRGGAPLVSAFPRSSPPSLFSLVDIPALETRSWFLSHFRIPFWGSRNTCPLIACQSASGPC